MKNQSIQNQLKSDLTMHTIKIKKQNILLLSDTHGKHRLIDIPQNIQIIIHCGDICNDGNMEDILDFFDWYAQLKIPHKIFIHGNHDLSFELEPEWSKKLVPKDVIWLNDETIVINDISIMGISAFPIYNVVKRKNNMDIIVSHYPPYGILDNGFGSKEISNFIFQYAPKYHVFGHNHSNYGQTKYKNIQYINASIYEQLCQKEKV